MEEVDSKEGTAALPIPGTRVVTDPAAADLLADPERRRWLEPFLQREHTLGSAAAALGVAPSTLHYRVMRLRRLGLLVIVRRERRAGMASPVYRASAGRFFVPFTRTTAETLEALAWRDRLPLQRTLVERLVAVRRGRGDDWGLRVEGVDGGGIRVAFAPSGPPAAAPPGAVPVVDVDLLLRLDRQAAAELAAALERLVRESETRVGRGAAEARSWFLCIGFAPLDD